MVSKSRHDPKYGSGQPESGRLVVFVGKIEKAFKEHLLSGARNRRFSAVVYDWRFRKIPTLESKALNSITEIHVLTVHIYVLIKSSSLAECVSANPEISSGNPVYVM